MTSLQEKEIPMTNVVEGNTFKLRSWLGKGENADEENFAKI